MKLSILGCGNWGSVFGIIQHQNNHQVRIWEVDRYRAEIVKKTRSNDPFLKDLNLPEAIMIDHDLEVILQDAEIIVFAVPTQSLRKVIDAVKEFKPEQRYLLSLCKGIDCETLERPSQIINRLTDSRSRTFVLSGPCIANEIARGAPTAAVLAGDDDNEISELQYQLSSDNFRVYKSNDIIGVEISAAIKNVIAIGCGISDGLGFGVNAKGALLTRALVEMQRLGRIMNAQERTFLGLAGIGDLITTAFSPESRNYRYGSMIARAMSENEIKKKLIMVAEGVPTARAVHRLAHEYNIDMPISEAVYNILYEGKSPFQAIKDLMGRPLKEE
ncbi:glycerol-3-phosphate dehydrogenase [candidate division WOR-3 bacterium RBG_13_43_14]|uniref:Glycerol-3-phosphate dehydrogenase [NAD(P)+] n=1 Tax=candidate division WOR-3 bacterium RBG_13_43_14 TaxID=1802590 RepID=A0A1F4UE91_UNCW3|nr:MAG: glycerol-3-phosphate dehydrogenase [candidate division WOR-3 bacterium RBG_13_43_14]